MLRNLSPIPSASANHELGNLSANPVITSTMKLASKTRCCQRWFSVMRTIFGFCIARRATALLRQMMALCRNIAPITAKIRSKIEPSHPAHRNRTDIIGMDTILQVHLGQCELLRNSLVALAAGGVQVGAIDGRAGIARRQNIMHAVATGAVGHHRRAAF